MKKLFLLIFSLFFIFFSLNAQILSLKRAKKSANAKTQQRVDNKVDEGIDKGLDSAEDFLFGKKKKKNTKADTTETSEGSEMDNAEQNQNQSEVQAEDMPDMSGFFGNNTVEVPEEFVFINSILFLMTTTDKKGENTKMKMKMHFPDEDDYFGMEITEMSNAGQGMPTNSIIIFDNRNQQMITMVDNQGQKMGIAMKMDEETMNKYSDKNDGEENENVNWEKTGKTKDILGYTCEQYIVNSEEGNGEFWMSDQDDLDIGNALNRMANSQPDNDNVDYPEGAMLEMNYKMKDGSTMIWEAIEIEIGKTHSIKTTGYQFMSLGQK